MTPAWFTFYDLTTGRILYRSTFLPDETISHGPTEGVVEGKYLGADTWIPPGTENPTDRPATTPTQDKEQVAADAVDVATITGLPDPCMVSIVGPVPVPAIEVAGGSLEVTFDYPGKYRVNIEAFPAKDAEVVIHAN